MKYSQMSLSSKCDLGPSWL